MEATTKRELSPELEAMVQAKMKELEDREKQAAQDSILIGEINRRRREQGKPIVCRWW